MFYSDSAAHSTPDSIGFRKRSRCRCDHARLKTGKWETHKSIFVVAFARFGPMGPLPVSGESGLDPGQGNVKDQTRFRRLPCGRTIALFPEVSRFERGVLSFAV